MIRHKCPQRVEGADSRMNNEDGEIRFVIGMITGMFAGVIVGAVLVAIILSTF